MFPADGPVPLATLGPPCGVHAAATRRLDQARVFVARGDAGDDSDVDLAVELDPQARVGLFALGALERRLAELVGRRVDLLAEPVEKPRLVANIDRDRRRAFQPPRSQSFRKRVAGRMRVCAISSFDGAVCDGG